MIVGIMLAISGRGRQEESCHYMSTLLFEWLRSLRRWRAGFVVGPIILGGVANWSLVTNLPELKWVVDGCALLAGFAPAVYKALDLDVSLGALVSSAHQFKILQDRFRQARSIAALGPFEDKAEFDNLMDRMGAAREGSVTAVKRHKVDREIDLKSSHRQIRERAILKNRFLSTRCRIIDVKSSHLAGRLTPSTTTF